jgi:DNA-binding NtrC family response regulator
MPIDSLNELNLVGSEPSFLNAVGLIRCFAVCGATVLIQGETGTGKELAARAIHYLGGRREHPFVPVNCGAIPDDLVENELFGHARGAFTDARNSRTGVVSEAEGGTLFLDEVETLSARGQVALLRFLQDQTYRPLGAGATLRANVRVIAASNDDLQRLQSNGGFRRDLYFRLGVMSLEMPPLRDRLGDVPRLAEHFVRHFNFQYGGLTKRLSTESLKSLTAHDWPGNVRELENLIHREFLLTPDGVIRIGAIHPARSRSEEVPVPVSFQFSPDEGLSRAKARLIAEFERTFLSQVLTATGGNASLAARRAGKERRTFGRLLRKYGIDRRTCLRA